MTDTYLVLVKKNDDAPGGMPASDFAGVIGSGVTSVDGHTGAVSLAGVYSARAALYARLADAAGVDPTGVTECAAAVQTYITANAGRTIFVNGQFLCGTKLLIPSNTTVIGEAQGSGFTFNWIPASGGGSGGSYYIGNATQSGAGNTGIHLRNLTITGAGSGAASGASGGASGILFRLGDNYSVIGCVLYRVPGVSIAYQGISKVRIESNFVYQGGRDGITGWWFTNNLTDVVVANNVIYQVGDDGIAFNSSTAGNLNVSGVRPKRIAVTGNTIFNQPSYDANAAGRGIIALGCEDMTITGNTVSDTFGSGIYISCDDQAGSALVRSRSITISGNVVRRAGQQGDSTQPRKGIRVLSADFVSITGNQVSESYEDGIYINDVTMSTVTGNVVHENGTLCDASHAHCGINLDGGSSTRNVVGVTVANNNLWRNAANGIRVYYSDKCPVLGNVVVDNGNAGDGSISNGAGIQIAGDCIYFVRGNVIYESRSSTARTQTYGIVAPALGGSPTIELSDNYVTNHPGPNVNIAASPAFQTRHGNHEGGIILTDTQQHQWVTKTANYTLTLADYGVFISGTSLTVTLPSGTAAGLGRTYLVKNTGASSVTVAATAGTVETTTVTAGSAQRYVSDGTNWKAL